MRDVKYLDVNFRKNKFGSFFLAVQITILVDSSNEPEMCK